MTEQDYLERVRALCTEHGASRVVLFGSRAHGTHRPSSDFDIAVYGGADVRSISEQLELLPTLFSADVVDMSSIGNGALVKEIEDHGITI